MDLRDRRELNNGAGDALNRACELVITPMVLGLLGYLLDGRLGTRPLFTLAFFLFTLGYVAWKHYRHYGAAMDREQARIMGTPRQGTR